MIFYEFFDEMCENNALFFNNFYISGTGKWSTMGNGQITFSVLLWFPVTKK
jgi:hypothetical protein